MKNDFEIKGDKVTIFLKRRSGNVVETIIDLDDLPRVQEYKGSWNALWDKSLKSFYVVGHLVLENGKRTKLRLHRLIMETPHELHVDHLNYDTLNNTRKNLRNVTPSVNQQNQNGLDRDNTPGYRGVCWSKAMKKWRACIGVNSKLVHLGYYADIKEAAEVAHNARVKYMPGYVY